MYACTHACMHACMYVCMYVCMCVHMDRRTYVHMYVHIYIVQLYTVSNGSFSSLGYYLLTASYIDATVHFNVTTENRNNNISNN